MYVLGIESSCDDTAVAIVREGREISSHVRHSQIDLHAEYGGVVPETASRAHLEVMSLLVKKAMQSAEISWADLIGVAATAGPGLIGSILVGLQAAKGIAAAAERPFIGINHLCGHIYAAFLQNRGETTSVEPRFPLLGVVVSGGHSALYRVTGWDQYELLGATRDDAAGEAFDKIAKWLGLGFPGGPIIDQMAEKGNPHAIAFPRPLLHAKNLDMSFSGIKTSVIYWMRERGLKPGEISKGDLAHLTASFREAIVDVIFHKIEEALKRGPFRQVVVAGGVAANSRLRERLQMLKGRVEVIVPEIGLCADNAAMIGGLGYALLQLGYRSPLSLNADPNLPMDWLKKGDSSRHAN
ncbi:MAG: tRNA (adenosine(37)-N6)-threonylcarbamoyltransferase complex transferase subunit TsaD [Deltaproteobacteria bacterium]|nr:tRNA (adenosine(37)-N6)-threonylcarbamoyltransferase complex transferase subunit TsaD [Deltaproteobacteria bacterium]